MDKIVRVNIKLKVSQLFPMQKNVLYNILKVPQNLMRGKTLKWVIIIIVLSLVYYSHVHYIMLLYLVSWFVMSCHAMQLHIDQYNTVDLISSLAPLYWRRGEL